jgi:hypothetical protein
VSPRAACPPNAYPVCVPRCGSVEVIAPLPAPNFASTADGSVGIASIGIPGYAPLPLSLPAATADADGLWNLALPIGVTVLFVAVVVVGVFVLRAVVTRRNPEIKEP